MELQSGQDMGQATMNHTTGTLEVHRSPTRHASVSTAIAVTKSSFTFRAALLFDGLELELFLKQSTQVDKRGD